LARRFLQLRGLLTRWLDLMVRLLLKQPLISRLDLMVRVLRRGPLISRHPLEVDLLTCMSALHRYMVPRGAHPFCGSRLPALSNSRGRLVDR
jgi:hypothetical protein